MFTRSARRSPAESAPAARPDGMSPRRGWGLVVTSVVFGMVMLALASCGVSRTPGGNGAPPTPTPTAIPACTTWTVVSHPQATRYQQSMLGGVNAVAPNDAWAVGSNYQESGPSQALIERWDGTSWRIVPGPSENLVSVAAISANDVWAVGSQREGLPEPYQSRALIEHWNGSAWSVVAGPALPQFSDSALQAITRIPGTNELWAVGSRRTQQSAYAQALIERWNGSAWSLVTPNTPSGAKASGLSGIVALSSADAWAVGSYVPSGGEKSQGLIEHWNGASWQPVPIPKSALPAGVTPSEFFSVAAASGTDVRAVGRYFVGEEGMGRALIAQWNGRGDWSIQASPTPSGAIHSALEAITTDGAGHYWAVGWYTPSASGNIQSLILRCP